jgi:NAD(P)-dependent dehydrogenase (short-subunit alcohol dehydrogenase family)
VAVTGHSHLEKAEEVVKEIHGMGEKAIALKMDLTDLTDVQAGIEKAEATLGPLDILVNNAAFGIVRAVTIAKTDKKDWDHDLSVNLTGAFNTIKCCMPGMTERGWGRIINLVHYRHHGRYGAMQLRRYQGWSHRPHQNGGPRRIP